MIKITPSQPAPADHPISRTTIRTISPHNHSPDLSYPYYIPPQNLSNTQCLTLLSE